MAGTLEKAGRFQNGKSQSSVSRRRVIDYIPLGDGVNGDSYADSSSLPPFLAALGAYFVCFFASFGSVTTTGYCL